MTNEVLVCKFEAGCGNVLVARLLAGPGRDSRKVFEQYQKDNQVQDAGLRLRYFTFDNGKMKFRLPQWISNPNNLQPATR